MLYKKVAFYRVDFKLSKNLILSEVMHDIYSLPHFQVRKLRRTFMGAAVKILA